MDRWDFVILIVLLGISCLYAILVFDFSAHPYEDAAILMRYSENLAAGHGIVWNPGEDPVDGATDFLFMLILAFFRKSGTTVEFGVRLIGFLSHFLTIIVIYLAVRSLYSPHKWVAALSGIYLALGPGLSLVFAYFGTPLFALFVSITWYLAIKTALSNDSAWEMRVFPFFGLLLGLIRPEGVFLAWLFLFAVFFKRGWNRSRSILVYFSLIFFSLGTAYFIWRWNYFGYPLPNPYYNKGGGQIHLSGILTSIKNFIILCLPFLLFYFLAFRSGRNTRKTVFSLIPIVGFISLWILLSNEMNFFRRFQYPVLPIVLISWFSLYRGIHKDWNLPKFTNLTSRARILLASLACLVFIAVSTYSLAGIRYGKKNPFVHSQDGRYLIANILNFYKDKNYTLATTEAGLIPLYSQWRVVDTWGLNDKWIAHKGEITDGYLDRYRPEIIMFHAPFSPITNRDWEIPASNTDKFTNRKRRWNAMLNTLLNYAIKRNYFLAASFGETPYDTHYYYIRRDFPESREIISKIQSIDYRWYVTGKKAINFSSESIQ